MLNLYRRHLQTCPAPREGPRVPETVPDSYGRVTGVRDQAATGDR